MTIVFGLENPIFGQKVTHFFLNVPRGEGGGVGPPVQELFLKNTNLFSASLIRNKCNVCWKKGWYLFMTTTRSTFCTLNKVPIADKEVNFSLRYWLYTGENTKFRVILSNGLVCLLCCLLISFSFLFVCPCLFYFPLSFFILFFSRFLCLLAWLLVWPLFVCLQLHQWSRAPLEKYTAPKPLHSLSSNFHLTNLSWHIVKA